MTLSNSTSFHDIGFCKHSSNVFFLQFRVVQLCSTLVTENLPFGKLSGLPWYVRVKESACNAGDPGLIPESGRSSGEGIGYPLQYSWASFMAQLVKNCLQCGRPGLGRSPGEGKGYPLQYPGLKNSIGCIVHGVTKSRTQLSNFHFFKHDIYSNIKKELMLKFIFFYIH